MATEAITNAEISFHCQHCRAALVIKRSGAGLSLTCTRCGKLTAVPKTRTSKSTADAAEQLEQIQRKLTENESQRTEVTGHINQLSIQLHRWQLRLQTLNERRQQLEKELAALKA